MMKTIEEVQNEIINDFNEMEDEFEQYVYLTELSGMLPAMNPVHKTKENLVKGCQSTVWLWKYEENGRVYFQADSDTFIIKGILYLLQKVLCGRSHEEIAGCDLFFLKETSITGTFESARMKGIGYIAKELVG